MKKKKKLYATGTSVKDYVDNPYTVLQQNKIDLAEAQSVAASNPLTQVMTMLGNMAMQQGVASGGFQGVGNLTEGQAGALNTITPILGNMQFPLGGIVEVEGGEVAKTPDNQLIKFKGANHSQGGIDVNLPDQTEIYSDRIKVEDKTMAERKIMREKNQARLEKLFDTKNGDRITKNALTRVMQTNDIEEQQDLQLQGLVGQLFELAAPNKMAFGTTDPPMTEDEWLKSISSPFDYNTLVGNGLWDTKYKPQFETTQLLQGKTTNPLEPLSTKQTPITQKASPLDNTILDPNQMLPGRGQMWPEDNSAQKRGGLDFENLLKDFSDPTTFGDKVGLAGNLISTFGPYLNTLKNRGQDTPNINAFQNFGEEGLQTLMDSQQYIEQNRDQNLSDLELARRAAIKRGRNSARSVNTMRSLDLATDQQINRQQANIYAGTGNQMMQLLQQKAEMENVQDRFVMQGEKERDIADRMDNDNYYTQLSKGISNIGYGLQETGKDINAVKHREVIENILNQLSDYGIKIDTKGLFTD